MFDMIQAWAERVQQHEMEQKYLKWADVLPLPLFRFICYVIGIFIYLNQRTLRLTIIDNMNQLLGKRARRLRKRQVRRYFIHLTKTCFEILILTRRFRSSAVQLKRLFKVQGEEHIVQALQSGRGVIVYSPHMGNFFFYYWYLSQRYPCLTVATPQPDIRFLYDIFAQLGCQGLDYDRTPPVQLFKRLRQHLEGNGVVMLLGDFYREQFPQASWFGKTTKTPIGAAMLALEKQVPIVPFHGRQLGGFRHGIKFEEPIYLHEQFAREDRLAAMNYLNLQMERMVRETPEQWFYWFQAHERFEELSKSY
jgi:lauroyl/myristoyl acyltransferase